MKYDAEIINHSITKNVFEVTLPVNRIGQTFAVFTPWQF